MRCKSGFNLEQMCWNASVSVVFGVVMFATAAYLKHIKYPYYLCANVALLLYGSMQFAQALNWLTVLPLSEYGRCTPANYYATLFAFAIAFLQPMCNVLAVAAHEKQAICESIPPYEQGTEVAQQKIAKRMDMFVLPFLGGVVVLVVGFIQLALGEWGVPSTLLLAEEDFTTLYDSVITCTYIGPGGYLLWRFKMYLSPLMPTQFVYQLFGLTIFCVSSRRRLAMFLFVFYGMALVSIWKYTTAESLAYWCASSVTLPPMFLFDAWLESRASKKAT